MNHPLEGIVVLDFSQFLSGPSASLRLADLGARVIKLERPNTGDICRTLYVSDVRVEDESTVFHAINRNKESFAVDLKNEQDKLKVLELIKQADIVMHNFRPGVMTRLGFDYATVRGIKSDIIYGCITGYGNEGPWKEKPGQDLLLQSLSGLTQHSGNRDAGPVPMGIAIVDILSGAQLVQGLIACLVRRNFSGTGGLVEVSMLESSIDLQFEPITLYWQDGGAAVDRTASNNAHPLLGAPYGIYETTDGHLAMAMGSIPVLGELLNCPPLLDYKEPQSWFDERDAIKDALAGHIATQSTAYWLSILEPADIWCAEVLNYKQLTRHEGYRCLDMEQTIRFSTGSQFTTTRCPIRLNGQTLKSPAGAPSVGEHNQKIEAEFNL